jgi:hypothetical protein
MGGLGAFMTANPYIAGAIGSALGKTIATGDIGEGIQTGLISGVTGGLMQGLTPGGDFIRSADAIGGQEALAAAADTANVASSDAASYNFDHPEALAAAADTTTANVALNPVNQAAFDALPDNYLPGQGVVTRLPESPSAFGAGQYETIKGSDLDYMDKIFQPTRPAYVHPKTGSLVKGQTNPLGGWVSGVGGAILEEAAFPTTYDFDEEERNYDSPQRFGTRDRFEPDTDYRGGVDPEFTYFSPTRFIADGGPVRMQMGGLAALEKMQGMDPTAAGLGAMAGVMEGANPDSSMMQIQEMMMEAPSPDGQMQDIVIVEAISAIRGEHANPELAIQAFADKYGQDALDVLVEQVNQEMMLEKMGQNQDMLVEGDGMIEGIGKGRDDMVQATLEGEKDVLLSDGEFVLPADVVSGIGDGSSKAGEDELMKLIDRVRTRRTGTKEPPNMVGEVMPA